MLRLTGSLVVAAGVRFDLMQFLTISRQKKGNGGAATLVAEEFRIAQALYSKGCIRQIWHRADVPGACIIWEAESVQHVREMLDSLPFARAELIEVSIIPLKPYAGFSAKPAEAVAMAGPDS